MTGKDSEIKGMTKEIEECLCPYSADDVATHLYNAGYRKQSDTAREILQELYDEANGMQDATILLSAYYIKNTLAKEYGVDLTENECVYKHNNVLKGE